MSIFRPTWTAFTIVALPAFGLRAQDDPVAPNARAAWSLETVNELLKETEKKTAGPATKAAPKPARAA